MNNPIKYIKTDDGNDQSEKIHIFNRGNKGRDGYTDDSVVTARHIVPLKDNSPDQLAKGHGQHSQIECPEPHAEKADGQPKQTPKQAT
jgi:hypothetical protein